MTVSGLIIYVIKERLSGLSTSH